MGGLGEAPLRNRADLEEPRGPVHLALEALHRRHGPRESPLLGRGREDGEHLALPNGLAHGGSGAVRLLERDAGHRSADLDERSVRGGHLARNAHRGADRAGVGGDHRPGDEPLLLLEEDDPGLLLLGGRPRRVRLRREHLDVGEEMPAPCLRALEEELDPVPAGPRDHGVQEEESVPGGPFDREALLHGLSGEEADLEAPRPDRLEGLHAREVDRPVPRRLARHRVRVLEKELRRLVPLRHDDGPDAGLGHLLSRRRRAAPGGGQLKSHDGGRRGSLPPGRAPVPDPAAHDPPHSPSSASRPAPPNPPTARSRL